MIEDVEITDNEFLRQFELEIGDNMARIEYALQDRKIFLTKYEMPEDLEEQGFREIFIKAVFEEVKNRGISLVPTSPEIAGFMRKNRRKYKDLLPVGINI
ncbi:MULTISPECIES: GNAT family N-acetyltransferase [Aequorivita]|jgi:predicted GNAT family acetyltransferase|uniref:Acetyltransferase n=3 Tax=Aequorivita TaxID=153265 RepID=A0A137RIJ3_9FLAO|nr:MULTISPECIES: N-acetyltransferase [Aequorivita]MAB39759.1 N-acetyltransferase [Aequorivita sp.]MDX1783471.1 N-acetyltransferase [Aequorivita vladivostokensis]KXO00005.1 acetyltransferase [Aequorivita aquimaris]MBG43192.1 N-acetyltransferase [Aequorivita sp.]MBP41288.1 N-acetyltransferase [Aequorivita sp.]|tara:strand:+ start:76163 stop:76462 length:300 start_codon:yes stop_codon:yes gene_type:complete